MQFHIDFDHGDAVVGWVLPDNPGLTPTIAASILNGPSAKFQANVFRPDLKDLRVHSTGMVGFRIDGNIFPGFNASHDITISEEDTGVLIYRRSIEDRHLPVRLLRLELSAMPQLAVDSAISSHFAVSYSAVERYSYDTLFAVLNSSWTMSHYLSGRPHLTRYSAQLKDRGFKTIALLREPLLELAERLVFLKFAGSEGRPSFISDHLTGLFPVLGMASRIDLNDENSIASVMNGLSDTERDALSNPFVRVLACTADEVAQDIHVSAALENLANLDLVGTYDKFHYFKRDLIALVGADIIDNAELASPSILPDIARKLGKLRAVHRLLALDIKLYRLVAEAIETAYGRVAH